MINCPKCDHLMPLRMYIGKDIIECHACKKKIQVMVFPELFKPLAKGSSGEDVVEGLDASCFTHAEKKAKSVCHQCGSYICELCEIPKGDKIICSRCFNNEDKLNAKDPFDRTYRQHSKVANTLVVFSIVLYFTSIILAPMALYISLKYLNTEEGFFRGKRKITKIILAVIASLIILFWAFIFGSMIMRF